MTEHSLHTRSGRRASKKLWRDGTLFHNFTRFPQRNPLGETLAGTTYDRLPAILKSGLLAPAHDENGLVIPDLSISVTGTQVAYDSLIFLHKFRSSVSWIYTMLESNPDASDCRIVIDEATPVSRPEDMEDGWPKLCQDEVYAAEPIKPAAFKALYVPQRYLAETAVQAALEPHDMLVFTY